MAKLVSALGLGPNGVIRESSSLSLRIINKKYLIERTQPMLTYTYNNEIGPLCHNYATAHYLAQTFIKNKIKQNYQTSNNNWKNIRYPLNINIFNEQENINLKITRII